MPQDKTFAEIIIIGGGILGLSLAKHLADSGKESIILEKEPFTCSHASGKNAGMFRLLYKNEMLTSLAKLSLDMWPSKDFFTQTGSIVLGRTLPNHHKELFEQRECSLNGKTVPYVYSSQDGLLDSESYGALIKNLALKSGKTRILCNTKVKNIQKNQYGNWEILDHKNQIFECSLLVNASGAWVNDYLNLQPELKISAQSFVRHLYLSKGWDESLENLPKHGFYWDEVNSWYKRNWNDSDTKLISACEIIPAHPDNYQPNDEIIYNLADKIHSHNPDSANNISMGKGWYCFRTYTEDQLPVIGFDEKHNDFYWLACFGGFGMSTSYAASYLASKEILNNQKMFPDTFRPFRVKSSVLA